MTSPLTLLHSERPKLYTILAFLSAIGLKDNFQYRYPHSNAPFSTFSPFKEHYFASKVIALSDLNKTQPMRSEVLYDVEFQKYIKEYTVSNFLSYPT